MSEQAQTPWYLDKPFLTVILSPLIIFLAKKTGISLSSEEIIAFAATVISFVIGHKWAGAVKAKAEAARLEAEAKVTDAQSARIVLEQAVKSGIAVPVKIDMPQ